MLGTRLMPAKNASVCGCPSRTVTIGVDRVAGRDTGEETEKCSVATDFIE
jgi:hypothetical protein